MTKWLENIKQGYKEGHDEIEDKYSVPAFYSLVIGVIASAVTWYLFGWKVGVPILAIGGAVFYTINGIGHKKFKQQQENSTGKDSSN
jgi:hypothetical protein